MRTVLFGAAVLIAMAAITSITIEEARACSIVPFGLHAVPAEVQESPIIAVGTWIKSRERVATLRVEEGLKGVRPGDELAVDNRTTYTAIACSPYDEPFREGFRFPAGERWFVMLKREVNGLWQVSYLSLAAWPEPAGAASPGAPTLADIRLALGQPPAAPAVPAGAGGQEAAAGTVPVAPVQSPGASAVTGDELWPRVVAVSLAALLGAVALAVWLRGRRRA